MSIDKRIIEEIEKYKKINYYISEQEGTLPDETIGGEEETIEEPIGDELSGIGDDLEGQSEPVDVEEDPDVEVVSEPNNTESTDEGGTEELDITDLVTTQKNMSDKQEEYMEMMIEKLSDLTNKLESMDMILNKINDLESKVEKYRQKTPEEKLQLRSLDSYPYNQKLTDFFNDKEVEMEKAGKNEYILTSDEVENYSNGDIKKSFNKPIEDEERF